MMSYLVTNQLIMDLKPTPQQPGLREPFAADLDVWGRAWDPRDGDPAEWAAARTEAPMRQGNAAMAERMGAGLRGKKV